MIGTWRIGVVLGLVVLGGEAVARAQDVGSSNLGGAAIPPVQSAPIGSVGADSAVPPSGAPLNSRKGKPAVSRQAQYYGRVTTVRRDVASSGPVTKGGTVGSTPSIGRQPQNGPQRPSPGRPGMRRGRIPRSRRARPGKPDRSLAASRSWSGQRRITIIPPFGTGNMPTRTKHRPLELGRG